MEHIIFNSNPVGAVIAGLLFCSSLSLKSAKKQFLDQVKINSISQLISGIFKRFQKLLKCFSGIKTSVLFLPTFFTSYPSSPSPIL